MQLMWFMQGTFLRCRFCCKVGELCSSTQRCIWLAWTLSKCSPCTTTSSYRARTHVLTFSRPIWSHCN